MVRAPVPRSSVNKLRKGALSRDQGEKDPRHVAGGRARLEFSPHSLPLARHPCTEPQLPNCTLQACIRKRGLQASGSLALSGAGGQEPTVERS